VVSAISIGPDSVKLQFANGEERSIDLVLFADGYNSIGQQLLFPDSALTYRGYMLWRGLLPEQGIEDSIPLGTNIPRLAYCDMTRHMVAYLIPDDHGSIEEGSRICNWAAYIPMSAPRCRLL
jgi:2-polyprenyl-6-methoxyphenol hydroxylase-like FAD-dependent oxidoreductase